MPEVDTRENIDRLLYERFINGSDRGTDDHVLVAGDLICSHFCRKCCH